MWLLLISTYNGFPPENAKRFAANLENVLGKQDDSRLDNVTFAVLGFGNSNWYATFQRFAKQVDSGLMKLGAAPFIPFTSIDRAQNSINQASNWQMMVLQSLGINGSTNVFASPSIEAPEPWLRISVNERDESAERKSASNIASIYEMLGFARAWIEHCEVLVDLREPEFQQILSIDIRLPLSLSSSPGDHLQIAPENSDELVAFLCRRLNVAPDTPFAVETLSPQIKETWSLGKTLVVKHVLKHYCALQDIPSRMSLSQMLDTLIRNRREHRRVCTPCTRQRREEEIGELPSAQ